MVGKELVVGETYVSEGPDEVRVGGAAGHSLDTLCSRLSEDLIDRLVSSVPRSVVRKLEALDCSVSENELWQTIAHVPDPDQRLAIHDVFALLRQDKVREAQERARLFLGESAPLSEIAPEDLPEVIDSDVIRSIPADSKAYAEALRRFMRTSRYRDWMLFMHPQQEAVAQEDFNGAAKLVGVSGSGKTCVVVHRAVRLARQYPDDRVLVLTLNRALAGLISQLVHDVAADDERARIDVRPFFALCRELILSVEPKKDRFYDEVTWKTNEHVDEIWQEYYRCEVNNYDARVLQPIHDSLLARGWSPERYLREEVDWLRSALRPPDRKRYLEMERPGRSVPLPRHFRQQVLDGLVGWEAKMAAVGVVDALGIAQALTAHLGELRPRYRCVLVDEAQDFGNIELQIIRQLVPVGANDVFLCGDAAQAVTTKYQSLRSAGIDVPGARSRKLVLNYRNSRDVLIAAYSVLTDNSTEEMGGRGDFEVLHPEYSSFSASTPLLLSAEDFESEIAYALRFARESLAGRDDGKACIAICGYSLYELVKFGKAIRVPVLDGKMDIDRGDLFLSDLEQTKGFEFDTVCVLNCCEGVLPSSTAPEDEKFRDLARLYVAMTRARTDLVLSFSGRRSPFLAKVENSFLEATWEEYGDGSAPPSVGRPRRLETHRQYGVHKTPWRELSGEQFLYTDMGIGLSTELIAKIRELIDGLGLKRGAERLRWKTMGAAAADLATQPRTSLLWGPEVGRQFAQLIKRLESLESSSLTEQPRQV